MSQNNSTGTAKRQGSQGGDSVGRSPHHPRAHTNPNASNASTAHRPLRGALGPSCSGQRGLPDAVLEAVRQRSRIEELFPPGALRRAGSCFVALCPWHNDHNPSLTVDPARNSAHCFVCNRSADPIAWIQEQQGLSFREAVEELARRYAIPIPEQDPQAAARAEAERLERQRLLSRREAQQKRFHAALLADLAAGGPGAAFLATRGLTPETAEAWGLGLNGARLMLPIRDLQGRCCGFSGRAIDGAEPKYKNTPADALFRKSELLFGVDRAAQAIRRSGEALLVEGPLDVIQLHQGGFPQAIAAMGTALAPGQRQALQRCGLRRLVVAFDADAPGTAATGRLISELRPMLGAGAFELLVLALPTGRDPDDLLRSEGAEALRQRLASATHWLTWELEQLLAPCRQNPDDLAVLQRCEVASRKLLAVLPNGILRQRAEHTLRKALGAVPSVPAAEPTQTEHLADQEHGSGGSLSAIERAEWRALRLFLASPECRAMMAVIRYKKPLHQRAIDFLVEVDKRLPRSNGPSDPLPDTIKDLTPRVEPELAQLLLDICREGLGARERLGRGLPEEVMAILDVLEPVG
jgi:DNA primase